jgi:hypothetical protein
VCSPDVNCLSSDVVFELGVEIKEVQEETAEHAMEVP